MFSSFADWSSQQSAVNTTTTTTQKTSNNLPTTDVQFHQLTISSSPSLDRHHHHQQQQHLESLPELSFYSIGSNTTTTTATNNTQGNQRNFQFIKDNNQISSSSLTSNNIQQVSIYPTIQLSTITGNQNIEAFVQQQQQQQQPYLSYHHQLQSQSSLPSIGAISSSSSTTIVPTNRLRSLIQQQQNKLSLTNLHHQQQQQQSRQQNQRINQTNQLKLKQQRRTTIHRQTITNSNQHWTINSLCCCSFSQRFPHSFYQHHRYKLDSLIRHNNSCLPSTSSSDSLSSSSSISAATLSLNQLIAADSRQQQQQSISDSYSFSNIIMGQKFSNFMGTSGSSNSNNSSSGGGGNAAILNSHTVSAAATMAPIVNDIGSMVNNSNNLNKTVMRDHHHNHQQSSPFHSTSPSHHNHYHQDVSPFTHSSSIQSASSSASSSPSISGANSPASMSPLHNHNNHNHNHQQQPNSIPMNHDTSSTYHFCSNNGHCALEEPERPARLDSLLDMPPVSLQIQKQHGWNENDRSLNIIVVEQDPRIVHRHPVAQSTDCVRGLIGYTKGLHVWEIKWPLRQRGTHAVVGVATAEAALHSNGYHPLVGATAESWGWDLGRNLLYHDLKSQNYGRHSPRDNNNYGRIYQHQFAHDPQFVAPESFLIVLDMDKGTLAFMAHGQYLGIAFNNDGIKGKTLYPIVSSVWGHCEITLRYINGLNPEPLPLKDIARRMIRKQLGRHRLHMIETKFDLPSVLKDYLQYKDQVFNLNWKPM
ncbi:SPRY domain-containing SOCS box protein 4 [Dermatophagoides pteronyssinus]|uniref:SPRY domain-containing SOCS box protein 4 n=1 Tax=Dermatophagoides pteronyssinus TaxID=6956 RepID=A0ABQ8JW26_DERPT|nr:SPRY domain-containing SOCS box protein 4 [Dermatophagoides pteronyssinus]